MRWLLVMMSGLAFTMGLLCGLLLQLPAGTLPADIYDDDHHQYIPINGNSRFRRSLSERADGIASGSSLLSGFREDRRPPSTVPRSASKGSFQSPPNPQIASEAIVSGGSGANGQGRTAESLNSPGGGQAKQNRQSVKPRTKENNGGVGDGGGDRRGNPPPPPPPPSPPRSAPSSSSFSSSSSSSSSIPKQDEVGKNKPVTSFTLRLKNTGEKFIVDSAVRREQGDDEWGEGRRDTHVRNPQAVRDKDSQTNFSKLNTSPLNQTSLSEVVEGALWSLKLDASCPKGFEPADTSAWKRKAAGMQVVRVEEGCGRMQNRLVTFKDGTQACARYRFNTDQIQGEVFSYYLAHLLNLTRHLPPEILLPVDPLSQQWRAVHLELSMAQWADGRPVVLTRWLDGLQPSYIPHELREDDRRLHPTEDILAKKTWPELCDLLQWSDLIVFDYLTANLDRLVNNMFNRQWNAEMMNNPAHNLERTSGGSLVFLDNESGLFHGYRLLDKYRGYHESLLDSLCVFRPSTAKAVKSLHGGSASVGQELQRVFEEGELHHRHVPSLPEKTASVLKDRLARVYEQIVKCEALYAAR